MKRAFVVGLILLSVLSLSLDAGATAAPQIETLSIVPDAHANGMPTQAARQPAATPLETLLNSDGTLNLSTGFSGSLDISGWSMALAAEGTPHFSHVHPGESANGAPALNPASLPDDAYWDSRFDYPPA